MSIRNAQATTIPLLLLVVATCVISLGWADPIAPSPYALEQDTYSLGPSASISNQRFELLRLAAILNTIPPSIIPGLTLPGFGSGIFPFNIIDDARECLASIINTKDCPLQIITSTISGRFGEIQPECCKAIVSVEEDCLAKIPIVGSLIPSVLTSSCSHTVSVA